MRSTRITATCRGCGEEFDSLEELENHDCDSGTGPKLVADGDGYPEVVESIAAFVLDDLGDDPGAWKVYRAKRIAANIDHTPSEVGHYLGRMAGRSGRLEDIDISDRPFEIELWDGTTGTPRRWRIERSAHAASTPDDDRLVADGGRDDPNVLPDGAEIHFNDDRDAHAPDRIEFLNGGWVKAIYKRNYQLEVYPPDVIEGVYTHTNHLEDKEWW